MKAYCEISQHLNRQGRDPIKIGKNLLSTTDPVENYLFQAIAKSYECAAKGSTYNIVDSTNMMLLIVDVPDWASANSCTPGPAMDSLRVDKNVCNLIEFPNLLDTFDETQVKDFLKNFQNQVSTVLQNKASNSTSRV